MVKTPSAGLKAWAELGRMSNLPTVLANVMVGCSFDEVDSSPEWATLLPVFAAVGLIYTGGMAMNDLCDEEWDRRHRPTRPLPSGRISRQAATAFMAGCIGLGIGLLAWLGSFPLAMGLLLLALVTAYNFLHKRFPASFVLMGGCRAMVYTVAAAAMFPALPWWFLSGFGGSIFLYTSTLTLIARSEHETHLGRRRLFAFAMPVFLLYPCLFPSYLNVGLILPAGAIALLWMARAIRRVWKNPPDTHTAILTWLSGMCLLDAWFLALLNQPLLFGLALGCFVLTHLAHQKVSGT